jgi:hypothetical protein
VWAAGSPLSKHGANTTETFDLGVQSLEAHAAGFEVFRLGLQ